MYNHYIPQSDGSFRRSSVPEQNRRPARQSAPLPPPSPKPPDPPRPDPCPPPPQSAPPSQSPFSILKKLLPKDMDAADLIIIALLLLIGLEDDCDDLSPVLTIALYFLL